MLVRPKKYLGMRPMLLNVEKSHTRAGLAMQGRSKVCKLLHTDSPRSQKFSEIPS